jgi:hypothetical protein
VPRQRRAQSRRARPKRPHPRSLASPAHPSRPVGDRTSCDRRGPCRCHHLAAADLDHGHHFHLVHRQGACCLPDAAQGPVAGRIHQDAGLGARPPASGHAVDDPPSEDADHHPLEDADRPPKEDVDHDRRDAGHAADDDPSAAYPRHRLGRRALADRLAHASASSLPQRAASRHVPRGCRHRDHQDDRC